MKLVAGIGLSGFRSFAGGDLQLLAPLSRVSLLAGQNNAGKSNALRFVQRVFGDGSKGFGAQLPFTGLDSPIGQTTGASSGELAIALHLTDNELETLLQIEGNAAYLTRAKAIFALPAFRLTDDDLMWFRFALNSGKPNRTALEFPDQWLNEILDQLDTSQINLLRELSSALAGTSGGPRPEDLRRVLSIFKPLSALPPVRTIDAFRQVREGSDDSAGLHNGQGLIAALAELDRPDIERIEDQKRFEAINRFVKTVLDDPTVSIQIPNRQGTIHVRRNGTTLPLENLGTGIHQVVILAAAATLLTDHIVCMEEPEIHLHPILQRKLLRYLATETSNQYLIATHSAHLLDSEMASIFHVTLNGAATEVRFAAHPKDQAAICADLGYRPSDLVQANSAVWVEGPSDRIYLRHWISLLDPALIEGVHYSVMFYGGRLLSHLSANDPDVDDFISLRRFNRHIAILIDSDKKSAQARINETKQRAVKEFDRGPGFAWVTKGYTIENYVPAQILAGAIAATHPRATLGWSGQTYSNPLAIETITGLSSAADKVAIARECINRWNATVELPLDLKSQLVKTVTFIRDANGLPPVS